jgi:hypothetical protein
MVEVKMARAAIVPIKMSSGAPLLPNGEPTASDTIGSYLPFSSNGIAGRTITRRPFARIRPDIRLE